MKIARARERVPILVAGVQVVFRHVFVEPGTEPAPKFGPAAALFPAAGRNAWLVVIVLAEIAPRRIGLEQCLQMVCSQTGFEEQLGGLQPNDIVGLSKPREIGEDDTEVGERLVASLPMRHRAFECREVAERRRALEGDGEESLEPLFIDDEPGGRIGEMREPCPGTQHEPLLAERNGRIAVGRGREHRARASTARCESLGAIAARRPLSL